ncbi:MAG: hypothetical protein GQ582_00815 [Methyloprofundus sp.]|nr:hypothetical protein [Methyloprofundus sp.]
MSNLQFLNNLSFKYDYLLPFLAKLPQTLAYRLVSLYGKVESAEKQLEREQVLQQMQQVFTDRSEAELKQWVDYFMSMQAREMLDTEFFQGLHDDKKIDAFVRFHQHEALLEARKQGRAVLITTGHIGRYWMVGVGLDRYGISMGTITRDGGEENTHNLPEKEFQYRKKKLKALRDRMKGPFLVEGDSVRPIYRALENSVMTLLIDVPHVEPQNGSIELPFLGRTARFPVGIAKIARKTNALIFPYYVAESRHGLDLTFYPALEATELTDAEIMQHLVSLLEQQIMAHPEQWWLWPALPIIWQS